MVKIGSGLSLASEVFPDRDQEKAHSEKIDRYSAAKRHQKSISAYILSNAPTLCKEYEALRNCGSFLLFRHYFQIGQYRLTGGCSCKKHLLCALCALRRSARLVKEMEQKVRHVMARHPHLVPVLITKTVKNGSDLDERYNHLFQAHKRLIEKRRNSLKGRRTNTVLSLVHGAFGSIEFKRGSGSGQWHPHPHEIALVDWPRLVKKAGGENPLRWFSHKLAEEWQELTSDSFIVDARRIDLGTEETFFKGLCEACKYALKMNELSHEDQVQAYKVLAGRRLVYTFGSLRGIVEPVSLHDDIEDEIALQPYIEMMYHFSGVRYRLERMSYISEQLVMEESYHKQEKTRSKRNSRLVRTAGFTLQDVKEWTDHVDLPSTYDPSTPF